MNVWQEKLIAEILLFVCLLVAAVRWAVGAASGEPISLGTSIAYRIAISVILASWVAADARARRQSLCYDIDTFIFFAWPVVLPCYLLRTRGFGALLTLLCFAGMCLAAMAAALVVYGLLLLLRG